MAIQNYEDYWKLTNAFTDYDGNKFLDTLSVCINFIETYKDEEYSEEKYSRLQEELQRINPINLISIRKSINQLVKLGFIQPFLTSFHILSNEYISARTNNKRETLLSKIVYSNSSFKRAVNIDSNYREINFLIKTLIEYGSLSKDEIAGLMNVDMSTVNKDFLETEELENYTNFALNINFQQRKYNQINHFCNLLGKLDNLVFVEDKLYFKEDAQRIFGDDLAEQSNARDPYLHRLYKNQLQDECEELFGTSICMVEKLAYPVLIASHIKPFILSDENESYDPNNGLLLSRTIDSLFDLKYISFTNDGDIIFSKRIDNDVKIFWSNYKLESNFLNDKRKSYLGFHRNLMSLNDARF